MALTLYGLRDSCRSQKAMVAAELAGVPLNCPTFSKDDAQSAEFKKKSPLGRTPLLSTPKGNIIGSAAVAYYIARLSPSAELLGRTFHERGQVDQWIEVSQNELEVPLSAWVYPELGIVEKNVVAMETAKADVAKALTYLNAHLMENTYIVGERVSLADVCVVTPLVEAYRTVFDADMPKKYPALFRWFHTVVNQKAFARVFGPVVNVVAAPMNLDEWKRTYSNTPDLYGIAMKYFWEKYDPSNNSLYYMTYDKVEGECVVDYLTSNMLNGFLQRFDPAIRKQAFSVIDVVGKEKAFDIVGVWLFTGTTGLPTPVEDHPSREFYQFKKLDHTKPEDKKLVEDYWCANEEVEGRPIADSKVFK